MKNYVPVRNPQFAGREAYWRRLEKIDAEASACIIAVYGRMRVGKTELIEQFFRGRPMLKLEGLQPNRVGVRRASGVERRRQISECMTRLARYLGPPAKAGHQSVNRWSDFFGLLVPHLVAKPMVLFLDEVQWMANYSDELLAELKPHWDDVLRHNPRLRIVLASSSPTFITGQLDTSSALYGRSTHLIQLVPFDLTETRQLLGRLGKSGRETLLATLAVGGIPEYLKQLKSSASVFTSLCENSFRPGAFFHAEKDQVLVSSLSGNRFYEGALDHLARHGPDTRSQLYQALSGDRQGTPAASFNEVLDELVEVGLVERQVPITVSSRNPSRSRHARYSVADEYLHFYYALIEPRKADIDKGKYRRNPLTAISRADFGKLMEFSLARWCRRNELLIARHLRFAGVLEYSCGPWFEQGAALIDLIFIRKDSKVIVCEMRYNSDTLLDRQVIYDSQAKVDVFRERNPRYAGFTFETALITMVPIPQELKNECYFTYLITADELIATAASCDSRSLGAHCGQAVDLAD